MVAYYRLIIYLIIFYSVASILSIPALVVYSSYGGLEGMENYDLIKFTTGNLGFSGSFCISVFYEMDIAPSLNCRAGFIKDFFLFGVTPASFTG